MAIIIPNAGGNTGGVITGFSFVGYNEMIFNATPVASTDPDHVGYLTDNMTSLHWNAGNDGEVYYDLPSPQIMNWAGIAGGNWGTAQTTISVWEVVNGVFTTQLGVIENLADDAPHMFKFDVRVLSQIGFRFTSLSALDVGEVGFGLAMRFPCLPNIGLTLAKFNNNDQMYSDPTENQLFSGTSTIRRARTTTATYGLTSITWIRNNWIAFSDSQKGNLVWFLWDSLDHPNDVSFGHWSAQPINYEKSVHTSITFSVVGDSQ